MSNLYIQENIENKNDTYTVDVTLSVERSDQIVRGSALSDNVHMNKSTIKMKTILALELIKDLLRFAVDNQTTAEQKDSPSHDKTARHLDDIRNQVKEILKVMATVNDEAEPYSPDFV